MKKFLLLAGGSTLVALFLHLLGLHINDWRWWVLIVLLDGMFVLVLALIPERGYRDPNW